jgi:RNA methyltransferase, TrmH family
VLTSVKNPKVAAAVRLRKRSFREAEGRFLVEGAQGVREALESAGGLDVLFTTQGSEPVVSRARDLGVDVQEVSEDVMSKLTATVTPQGLVGVAPYRDIALSQMPSDGCLCVLHEVRDPGNAGTVLRSADAAGAGGVIFSETSVDLYNPKTVRASAGSIFHLPVAKGLDTADAVASLKGRGFRVLAMAADGESDLYRSDMTGPVAFLFGNEAHGLPAKVRPLADQVVRVPIAGKAESLNLAAAATVCLFEWARRRNSAGEALEAMIAAAAHDIRSPLTAMKGFGYALEKRSGQMTDEQRQIMLHGIVHDADRMDTILRQLVDAARVVSGDLELFPERVDLGDLVRNVSELLLRDPDHPPVEWQGGVEVVFLDPARLRTALMAFSESLVWWAREGPIKVEFGRSAEHLVLTASRATTELTSERADALFTPRREGSGGGSKIGLFVARGVAQAQGGRAWASVDDGRLCFHLELPAS